ncbi:MAG: hypothetical protein HY547_07375 [Elusimicrobia bacterium]|nr:hypothetical protein [Elusimicrobiota bacterium]
MIMAVLVFFAGAATAGGPHVTGEIKKVYPRGTLVIDGISSVAPAQALVVDLSENFDDLSDRQLLAIAIDRSQPLQRRVQAVYALRWKQQDVPTRYVIRQWAREDRDFEIRRMSLRILGWALFDEENVEFLLAEALTANNNEDLRLEAIRALGHYNGLGAADPVYGYLAAMARPPGLPALRAASTRSLHWALLDGSVRALETLRKIINDESDLLQVREAARLTLRLDPEEFTHWICPDNPQECLPKKNLPWDNDDPLNPSPPSQR